MATFNNILCVLQPGDNNNDPLERAVFLAESQQASVTVVMLTDPDDAGADWSLKLEQRIAPFKERVTLTAKPLPCTDFTTIAEEAVASNYDLIIKQVENEDWYDRLLGSGDIKLLRKCPCPVWLLKPNQKRPCQAILATIDVDNQYPDEELTVRLSLNLPILRLAAAIAKSESAKLYVGYAWELVGESTLREGSFIKISEEELEAKLKQEQARHSQLLEQALLELKADIGEKDYLAINPQPQLVKGSARKEIPLLADRLNPDLLIMGTVARTGLSGAIMGNTAETILNHISCSVLAIKPPGFHSH